MTRESLLKPAPVLTTKISFPLGVVVWSEQVIFYLKKKKVMFSNVSS